MAAPRSAVVFAYSSAASGSFGLKSIACSKHEDAFRKYSICSFNTLTGANFKSPSFTDEKGDDPAARCFPEENEHLAARAVRSKYPAFFK